MEQIWDNLPAVAGFAVPFLLVLGLVGLAALLWQRFRIATGSPTSRRGKQSRLAVIDTAAVDARRRLVLIRRDDAEHLIMIGGPTDIVIEPNIGQSEAFSPAREAPAAASPDRPVRRPPRAETAAPASPAFEAWIGPRPDPVQAAAREPIVIPQQELRQEAGQISGQGSSQGRHEKPIPPPASRNPPAPERPAAAPGVNTLNDARFAMCRSQRPKCRRPRSIRRWRRAFLCRFFRPCRSPRANRLCRTADWGRPNRNAPPRPPNRQPPQSDCLLLRPPGLTRRKIPTPAWPSWRIVWRPRCGAPHGR